MREILTTLLDTLGLLLVAAGAAAAVFPWVGWTALIVAGVVVLAGSAVATWLSRPRKRPGGGV